MKDGKKEDKKCRFELEHEQNTVGEVVEEDEEVNPDEMRINEFGTIKLAVAHEFNLYNS